MILLARALVAVLSFLLLLALALAGLAVAVSCIGTGSSGLSLAGLAGTLHLPELRDNVGEWLGRLEAPGPVAVVAGLGGLAAVLVGLLLLAGVLVPRRERLVTLSDGDAGRVSARRRPLARTAEALLAGERGLTDAKVQVRPRRSSGGTLRVRAQRSRPAADADVSRDASNRLRELTEPFKLRARVDVARGRNRVQ